MPLQAAPTLREPCQDSPQRRWNGQDPLCIPVDKEEMGKAFAAQALLCFAQGRSECAPALGMVLELLEAAWCGGWLAGW